MNSSRVTADPCHILLRYALGDVPGYSAGEGSPTVWLNEAHRGVHLLRDIPVPRSQRRYVFSPRFEFRVNTAFEEVLRGCTERRGGRGSWITPALFAGYLRLHRMGFAHSFETWCGGNLAGGCFAVQVGAYVAVESLFYRVSHASKAAYGRALGLFKRRGFLLVESNPVQDASRNYGEEWVPAWRFAELHRRAVLGRASVADGVGCPPLPWRVRAALPLLRLLRRVQWRLASRQAGVPRRVNTVQG